MSTRRKEDKQEISAETQLAPQLGTDTVEMQKGRWDIRKHTNLPSEIVAICGAYFSELPDFEGGEFAREFFKGLYHGLTSVKGWNVNKEVQIVAASKGAPSVGELKKKPGWIGRNVTEREWKTKAEEEGQTVVE